MIARHPSQREYFMYNEAVKFYHKLSPLVHYQEWAYCPHCREKLVDGYVNDIVMRCEPIVFNSPYPTLIHEPCFVFKCACGWVEGDGADFFPLDEKGAELY